MKFSLFAFFGLIVQSANMHIILSWNHGFFWVLCHRRNPPALYFYLKKKTDFSIKKEHKFAASDKASFLFYERVQEFLFAVNSFCLKSSLPSSCRACYKTITVLLLCHICWGRSLFRFSDYWKLLLFWPFKHVAFIASPVFSMVFNMIIEVNLINLFNV